MKNKIFGWILLFIGWYFIFASIIKIVQSASNHDVGTLIFSVVILALSIVAVDRGKRLAFKHHDKKA